MDTQLDSAFDVESHALDLEISADIAQHLVASLLEGERDGFVSLASAQARMIRFSVADLHTRSAALLAGIDASASLAVGGQA